MLRRLIYQAVFLLQWSMSSMREGTLQVSKLIFFQIFLKIILELKLSKEIM